MSVRSLRFVIASASDNDLKLYLIEEPNMYRAIVKIEKLKRKAKVALKFVGDDKPSTVDCRIVEDSIESGCFATVAELVDKRFPGVRDAVFEQLKRCVDEWEKVRLVAELRAEEKKLGEGMVPLIEEEVEGKVVRVLAPDGAYLSSYGSYVDLGDYVVMAETTYGYVEVETEKGVVERIEPIGIAVIYKRDGGSFTLIDKKLYYPSIQNRIRVGDKLVRLRSSNEIVKPDYSYSFPDFSTFQKVLNGEPLGKSWSDIGNEIVENLKNYVVFDDDRLYDVVASYIVMTYFYDVFTAVPYLWLHGPPGSGKTRANITITYMCRRGLFVADPSDATLYRIVEAVGPTLGIDESVLSEKGKRILAAGYKKGAVVPRAEPTKGGILLKLFEATAPRIFSFENPPSEDYMLQRSILVNMLKAKPKKFMDPQPIEFKPIREALYYLRLLGLPRILEAKDEALKMLEDNGIWGRDAEVWAPILTAAILIGRDRVVLGYAVEDVGKRKANELIYDEEKVVLAAIDELFSRTPTLANVDEENKVVEFMPKELRSIVIEKQLEDENCIEIVNTGIEERKATKNEPRCKELEKELDKRWKPQKIGLVLRNLGFDKFKTVRGKGSNARYVYRLRYGDFVAIAKRYDYVPRIAEESKEVGGENA
jgi:DNA polymerase III delta prime subunit